MVFFFTASCQPGDGFNTCQSQCNQQGNLIGINITSVETIFDVSIIAYQLLECPEDMFGPGCEQRCACSERETCHYIKGCHRGKITVAFSFFLIADLCCKFWHLFAIKNLFSETQMSTWYILLLKSFCKTEIIWWYSLLVFFVKILQFW